MADDGASFFGVATVDEPLVIDPVHPAAEETAAEGHLEIVPIAAGDGFGVVAAVEGGVDGLAVDAGDAGDVFGGFEAAFDFEAADAELDEVRDFVDGGEVLRGEEIGTTAGVAGLAVDDELIGHAAGLGAFAAIGAAVAEAFASETLTGVGDAEGSVDEDLEGDAGVLEAFEFAEGEFAGEDGAVEPETVHEGETFRRRDGHLGARVEFEVRGDGAGEEGEADVLDDDGVDAGGFEETELVGGGGEFAGEDERVHGHEAADPAVVEELHDGGEIGFGEVVGAETCVEAREAEVDGVGAVGDGGPDAFEVAGWGEQFGEGGSGGSHDGVHGCRWGGVQADGAGWLVRVRTSVRRRG